MNVKTIIFSISFLAIISCSPVEKAKNYKEISNTHLRLAVLPPIVNIEIKSAAESKIIKDQEKLESGRFQKSVVDYINLHSSDGDFFVTAQSEIETNQILADNNIKSLTNESYQSLAKLLNVDAVISSRVSLAKPMTNAEAFFTSLLAGPGAYSKVSTIDLSITDAKSGKMFWNYNYVTGGTFSSTEALTNSLMKSAAYRFPYKKGDIIKK